MFIVIEGVDASGKETQTKLLCSRFENAQHIEFPDYKSDSSTLVKMYLAGDFGKNAEDVSPYAASVLFACDRFASYKTKWKTTLDSGGIVIADRYVSSNLIHQSCKIDDELEKQRFTAWLEDFEYNIMGIPRPDFTIFLDMPPKCAEKLIKGRSNKIDGSDKKDIHESDDSYMSKAYNTAVALAKEKGWFTVHCAVGDVIKSPQAISEEVFTAVSEFMKG